MTEIYLRDESYKIIGLCMKVHRELGPGFKEVIYKDALELEFQINKVPYEREKSFSANYLGLPLRRKINVDFIIYSSIVLEAKATSMIIDRFVSTLLHYLKMSGFKLGIIANFGEKSFKYKRVLR
jgi:GxxExxY protein